MSRSTKISLAGLLLILAAVPAPTLATVIYEQAHLNSTDRGAYEYVGQELADDFVAGATATLTNATWTGSYYGGVNGTGSESFTLNLFVGGAQTPGTLIFSDVGTATFVGSSHAGYFDYALNLSGPVLTAGQSYWVSIYSNDSPTNYAWANSDDGTSDGAIRNNGDPWDEMDGYLRSNHVFALNGGAAEVPEPATLALIGLSVAGLGVARRRRH